MASAEAFVAAAGGIGITAPISMPAKSDGHGPIDFAAESGTELACASFASRLAELRLCRASLGPREAAERYRLMVGRDGACGRAEARRDARQCHGWWVLSDG